jgi:CheY-like chemotaxis protein
MADKIYSLTEAGQQLRAAPTPTLDEHHLRILFVIDGDTHVDVIRGWLRHYTDALLDQWLHEIEKDGLVTSRPASSSQDTKFGNDYPAVPRFDSALTQTDVLRLDSGTLAASAALRAHGVFLADQRLMNRPQLDKEPADIAVLLVEDDPDQAALAERRLQLAGYRVRVADSQRAFVDALRDHGVPQIVLLDVDLPDGNGFDILAYVRSHPRLSLLPVIMVTARNKPEDIRNGLALGADGYIPKPYSKSVLTDAVRHVLKHR